MVLKAFGISNESLRTRLDDFLFPQVGVIGSAYDAHQFAVIEPVQEALRAVVDDRVARAGVVMSVHVLMTKRAVNLSQQILRVGRASNQRPRIACAKLLD